MSLTRIAVTRVQLTLTLLACIVIAGVLAYGALPKAEDPGFTIRQVSIATPFPGASPRRVEELVSARIEEELQQIPELSKISSTSRGGLSIVIAEIDERIEDIVPVQADIRDAVDDVQDELPDNALESVVETDIATVYGVLYGLTYEGFSHAEAVEAAERIKRELLLLSQARKVTIFGDQERRIAVRYDPARLARMGLSPGQISQVLQTTNITTPGGEIVVGEETLSIEPSGSFESIASIRDTLLRLPSGELVALGDVARVEEELVYPPDPHGFVDGAPALFIGVSQRDAGDSELFGAEARAAAHRLRGELPLGLELTEVNFQPDDVDGKISSFQSSLVQSIVIVFVVMMLFLGVRTGLIVASLIPSVICGTFLVMSLLGVGIDQMSLAALLIALGMLVDNAIVMAENTIVRMQRGTVAVEATVAAAAELRMPLLISSLTTCAAFLPVYLAPGGASEFVGPIFVVVTIALLVSWVLATTTLPLVCVLFLKTPEKPDDDVYNTPFYERYRSMIGVALRQRWLTLAGATVALGIGLWGMTFVRVAFFPPSEKPAFTVKVELPAGTTADRAVATLSKLRTHLRSAHEAQIVHTASMQGDTMPRFSLTYKGPPKAPGSLAMVLTTKERAGIEALAAEIESWVESNLPGATVSARPLVMGPGGAAPIAIDIGSTDEKALLTAVQQTKEYLRSVPGTRNIVDDWGERTKKLSVRVDPSRARLAGVTNQDVAISLLTALSGAESTELRMGTDAIDVELLSADSESLDLLALRNLTVFSQNGPTTLQQVGDIEVVWDFGVIKRLDRRRTMQVSSYAQLGVDANSVHQQLQEWAAAQEWENVVIRAAGEQADSSKANRNLASTLPQVAMIIFLLLMFQFNDVRKTVINLAVLPFSLVGVSAGLLLFDSYIGFITLLAIISLFGIVLNNGNVLLDRIGIELSEGREPYEAIVEASVQRLRPILLTTATTVTGLVPLYLGGGPMFEPLAVTLMVGLVFGTALTLGLVPVMYAVLFRVPAPSASQAS